MMPFRLSSQYGVFTPGRYSHVACFSTHNRRIVKQLNCALCFFIHLSFGTPTQLSETFAGTELSHFDNVGLLGAII